MTPAPWSLAAGPSSARCGWWTGEPSVNDLTREVTLDHERVANESKHWVRLTAACNSRCIFCLDVEAQDGKLLPFEDIQVEIDRGRADKDATRLVISGGEASIHPRFHDAIRYGRKAGYTWIQTVTNGQKLADRQFFSEAMDAGLDEITFSLHGHTAELHDRLTRTKNGFANLMKAMLRAVRDGRPVVNVDVCINRQNVEHLEAIVALCARIGVREFDLLHVIPQGEAWKHRDELFYDPALHAESLKRVFRLARAPGFHIWTNRFPVAQLEDLEELIQDPHKMLDEVGGRRTGFRRYLDTGEPLGCRDAERCPQCFIEPFCSALDALVDGLHTKRFDVWWVGDRDWNGPLPAGASLLGVSRYSPSYAGPVYLKADTYPSDVSLPPGSRIVLHRPEHLSVRTDATVEVHLGPDMVAALPAELPDNWILHVPTRATAEEAARDPDWRAFFTARPKVRAQGATPCQLPGARIERPLAILDAGLFHADGRIAIDAVVDRHVSETYRVKSMRCGTCAADPHCEGGHVQAIRATGFRTLQPVSSSANTTSCISRLRDGSPPQPAAPRVPVAGNPAVPFIDEAPGRRS